MKTYIITLSRYFPAKHSKAGMPTNFKEKFIKGEKMHTIRANFRLWEKRIKEVQAGDAVLSIRQWTGKPYRSKQVEIAQLTATDGVGIQKICFLGEDFNGGYIKRNTCNKRWSIGRRLGRLVQALRPIKTPCNYSFY